MPLDPSLLATEIAAQLSSQFTPSTSQATSYVPSAQWNELATAIANAVVAHITANAVVLPGSFNVPGVGTVVGQGTIT